MALRLLDLCCCSGGAAVGYARAGFEVIGVDIAAQVRYPFPYEHADALDVLDDLLAGGVVVPEGSLRGFELADFDAIHASPPCQGYTALVAVHGNAWPRLIPEFRERLAATGLAYVIENVQGAPVRRDLVLCGEMFGLGVIRHRYFELGGWSLDAPAHVPHRGRVRGWRHGVFHDGPYVAPYGRGGGKGSVPEWQAAMGIDWTDDPRELAEAIPPAYTEFVGAGLVGALAVRAAA